MASPRATNVGSSPMRLVPASRPSADAAGGNADAAGGNAEAALRLLASTLDGSSLSVAAHNLVGQLAAEHRFTRASLGLLQGGLSVVVASSNLNADARGADLLRLIGAAMDEAIEQGESGLLPAMAGRRLPIMLAHTALQRQTGGSVATVPLAARGQGIGALVVERSDGAPIALEELQWLEHTLALVALSLNLLQRDERPLTARLRNALGATARGRFGASAGRLRWWTIGLLPLLLRGILPVGLEVGGSARMEGSEQRVLAAPTDGFLKAAQVRPGDVVEKGALLAELIEHDLMLERTRWASQLAQHENAYTAAMARADRTEVAVSPAKATQA